MSIAFNLRRTAAPLTESPRLGGAALWLVQAAQLLWKWAGASRLRSGERQMEVVETLALGGRKQLLLVRCGGESFLVGTGADSVQSIIRVTPQTTAKGAEEISVCC